MSLTFSIRDYTSKMRSRDVFKCWPFPAGDTTADEVRSWLPPMTVSSFRSSSGELNNLRSNRASAGELENPPEAATSRELAKSEKSSDDSSSSEVEEEQELENPPEEEAVSRRDDGGGESEKSEEEEEEKEEEEKLEMVCPVCRDFNAATLTAVNAHIDGCLREERRKQMRRSKSKSKAPKKKRSIAEIFDVEEEEQEQEEDPQEQQHERSEIETAMKFWPFGEDVSVTVVKFRWLSRRLEALRSNNGAGTSSISSEPARSDGGKSNSVDENLSSPEEEEKSEMVCPVCRVFKAATVTAANAHIDGCLAHAMREERWQMRKRLCSNSKPKPPKKRSIAEILTLAPQIDVGNSHVGVEAREEEEEEEEEDDDDDDDEGNRERVAMKSKKSTNKEKKKKKKKVKKVMKKKSEVGKRSGVVPLNNESKKMKKKKKKTKRKKKKKNLFNNELAATKEDAYKSKVQNSVNRSRKLKGIGNKTVKLDDIDASFTHEKKLDLKILSEEKKEQVKQCDSVGKPQKALSPIRGILKNHKHISGSTSSGCNIQEGTEESHCDAQVPTSDRHVRFSGKDYILGPKDRNSFDETASNLASDALACSLAKEQSSGSDEATGNLETNRNDDNTAISTDKRKEVRPILESKQFSCALGEVAVQNFLKPCTNQEKSKHLVEKGEPSSNVAFWDKFDKGNTTPPHCSAYADVSRALSALQAGQISGINTQVRESGAFVFTRKFIDRLEDPSIQSATMYSNANTRTFLEPSSSHSASYNKGNERTEFRLHTYGDNDNNGKASGGRPSSYTFSADMIDNSFLFPGRGKGSVKDNRMDQNFFGLPLNSHGELINFSSIGKVGVNQPDTSCTLRGSSSAPVNDILHQNSQEYLSLSERKVVQKTLQDRGNPFPHYPARLGVSELHGRGRADIFQHNSDRCSNHFVQQLDSELNLARSPYIEQNQRDKMPNHKGNGMTTPKESSDLISPSSSQPTMRLMGKDFPIGGSSKEKQQFVRGDAWAGEETRRRHYSEDAAINNSLLGRCSKRDWTSGSQLQTSTEDVLQSVKVQSNPSSQSTFLMKGNLGVGRNASSNQHHITQAPTSCAAYNKAPDDLQWQFVSGAKPQALSFQFQVLPTPQPTSPSQGEQNDRRRHHHVNSSAFGFPFLHPVIEEQAKAPLFQRSGASLPSWLLGSTHEGLPGTSANRSFPQGIRGNNFATPSANHSAEFRYPPKTPLCAASIVQPPHVPVIPLTKIPSAINSEYRNITQVTDRVKLNDVTTNYHHPCTNTRKRPAATNLVDLTRPNKLPNREVQENLSRMNGLAGESSSIVESQQNAGAVELDPQVNGARSRRPNEPQNVNPTSYLGFDSLSGPVRVSPGAKCILRPSQNIDQDSTRTIHSAIPISATTDCDRDLELQRRLTKMYRF